MKDYDLSIIIPARHEMFLKNTVEDILKNKRGKTEIIVGLDGELPLEPILDHPDVTLIYYQKSIGQRAISNQCVRASSAKYIMKLDAHCALDEGFDVKMMEEIKDDWTMIPKMYNLHAFNWLCKKCNNEWYQGPTPKECPKCDNMENFERKIIWKPRLQRESETYRFDNTLHFQYHGDRKHWGNNDKEDIIETMSAQGSCFMLTREKYWELNICDETFGSWGQQGVEVALKTWLSGGRLVVNKKTWYSHMFRTQGGDFGFPYPISGRQVEHAREYSRDLFFNNKWEKQIYPLSWLIEKFKPLTDWHDKIGKEMLDKINKAGQEFYTKKGERKLTKGVVWYTDNMLPEKIEKLCQKQLLKGIKEKHIVSVSLKPVKFGKNIVLPLERGWLSMFKQILIGLEALDTDIAYLIDHDVLYHPSHFAFVPPRNDKYYYNHNCWRIRPSDGFALHYEFASGCVADRKLLIAHYKKRIEIIEDLIAKGEHIHWRKMGFEAGTHNRAERIDDIKAEYFKSEYPNIDIRWGGNNTSSRWTKEEFRSQKNCQGWTESDINHIEGWPDLPELVKEFI